MKSKMAAMQLICTVSKLQTSPSQFAIENVSNRNKTVLVAQIALNTMNLSEILMLWFMS